MSQQPKSAQLKAAEQKLLRMHSAFYKAHFLMENQEGLDFLREAAADAFDKAAAEHDALKEERLAIYGEFKPTERPVRLPRLRP
jgi:hypothetical protein